MANTLTDLSAIVTDVGLAAASVASPTGPWINLVKFKVGSGFGYTASRYDTGLNGVTLYDAPITHYRNVPPKTLNVMCVIPAAEGPFEFGELGIYLPDDVLFAKLVFPTLQLKTSSLVTNVASSYTFNCLINLEQSTAIFQINNGDLETIWVVNKWSDVLPQTQMPNPAIDLIIVQEGDPYGRSTALVPSRPQPDGLGKQWSPQGTYQMRFQRNVIAATTTSITIDGVGLENWNVLDRPAKSFVVQFDDSGYFRAITGGVQIEGGAYKFDLAPDPMPVITPAGSLVTLWEEDASQDSLATATTYGISHPGSGIAVPSPGIIETYGLVHGVPGAGRILTSADSMMSLDIPSGVHDIIGVGTARPTGMPAGTYAGGQLYRTNTLQKGASTQTILDIFLPYNAQTGTATAPFSAKDNKAWFHEYKDGVWSPWRTMTGSEASGGASGSWSSLPPGTPAPGKGFVIIQTRHWGNGGFYLYINGILRGIANTSVDEDDDMTTTLPMEEGDSWSWSYFRYGGRGSFRSYQFFNWEA